MIDQKGIKRVNLRHYPAFPHVGVGILLIRDNQLLLVKRKYDPDAGYWSIPGGHLDLGEEEFITYAPNSGYRDDEHPMRKELLNLMQSKVVPETPKEEQQ